MAYDPQKRKAAQARFRAKHSAHELHLKARYGLSLEEFAQMLEQQNFSCKICGRHFGPVGIMSDAPCVDHNHTTGAVRALLCRKCNAFLGFVEDRSWIISNIVSYMKEYAA